ncbi:hypothetical protein CDEST_01214 [Colletotrichum destructivum]|uniref:Uncharacterized protein n=1 Tax=Colletotrichum destructivum TaxID=34406 RepID=A0AAX4HZN1_9PEZI|nr:hypothetical protein CDEST_01214 [Colletotrichum destructivum]
MPCHRRPPPPTTNCEPSPFAAANHNPGRPADCRSLLPSAIPAGSRPRPPCISLGSRETSPNSRQRKARHFSISPPRRHGSPLSSFLLVLHRQVVEDESTGRTHLPSPLPLPRQLSRLSEPMHASCEMVSVPSQSTPTLISKPGRQALPLSTGDRHSPDTLERATAATRVNPPSAKTMCSACGQFASPVHVKGSVPQLADRRQPRG